jgi:hypothetical protein
MMNMVDGLPPPEDIKDETRAFFSLLNLVTDPKALAERITKLWEAGQKAGEAIVEAKAAKDQLAVDRAAHDKYLKESRAAHDKYLKESRAAHDAKLTADRKEFEAQCGRRDGESQNFSAKAQALLAKAKDDAARAAERKANYEQRLAKIREATA